MRPLTIVLPLCLVALPAFADDAKVYTNKDLPAPPKADDGKDGKKVVTNDDLAKSEGNLTYTDPADDTSYEADLPAERKDDRDDARDQRIAELKARYQELRKRQDEIEAELPAVREAASRELGEAFILVNGVPTKVVTDAVKDGPNSIRLEELEHELGKIQAEVDAIEREAKRRFGLGRPGLMQK
ncbi:MAG: hypothetical protein U0166_10220 [Acidobacteriota bacterium]